MKIIHENSRQQAESRGLRNRDSSQVGKSSAPAQYALFLSTGFNILTLKLSVMKLNRITLLDGYWYKSEIA